MRRFFCSCVVATSLCASPVRAEVLDASAAGFTVKTSVDINAAPADVYDTVVARVGLWWSPDHTWSGDPRHMSIDARAGGCFCETLDNGSVQHMIVLAADRGSTLRMSGALGPLQELSLSGVMTLAFTDIPAGTRLEMTYRVGGYAKDGLVGFAPSVDKVLAEQVARLKRFVETGKP